MAYRTKNSRRLAALRAFVLLLFLPAHVAFVLLIDLNFIPGSDSSMSLQRDEDPGPDKERLRLHLHRQSGSSPETKPAPVCRDIDPGSMPPHVQPVHTAAEGVALTLTNPASIRIWLAATPHNHRAPPA